MMSNRFMAMVYGLCTEQPSESAPPVNPTPFDGTGCFLYPSSVPVRLNRVNRQGRELLGAAFRQGGLLQLLLEKGDRALPGVLGGHFAVAAPGVVLVGEGVPCARVDLEVG